MLSLRNKNAVIRILMTRMMIRQKTKEKTKFIHIKIPITVVAQKLYSAEHRTRIDAISSTSLTALQEK